jgi:hypothetical protein
VVTRTLATAERMLRRERDGTFDGSQHIAEAHVIRGAREPKPTARSTLRLDETGAFQLLEDLLEEAERDPLSSGDVAHLGRLVWRGVEREIEDGPHGIPSTVREPQHDVNVIVASEISRITFDP